MVGVKRAGQHCIPSNLVVPGNGKILIASVQAGPEIAEPSPGQRPVAADREVLTVMA
jgi:hypothetical protein